MLSAIASALGGQIIDSLLGKITGVFQAYFNKQITQAQLRAQLLTALVETFGEIEKAHADVLAKTYASFMDAAKTSPLLQRVWAIATLSQLFVLVWHQFVIPFIVFMGLTARYPSSGTTVEWAYLLVGALLGLGPLVLRNGPGALSPDKLKALIK
ncbi:MULTISPECIES: hypothetical protein [unclassified Bradyrhizobium]